MNRSISLESKTYEVLVGYDASEVARDEYSEINATSPKAAACAELEWQFRKGERNNTGEYEVTVLVDNEPKVYTVIAEAVVECYIAD